MAILTRMVLSAPALGVLLCGPWVGGLVDRLGRRQMLIAGFVLYGLRRGVKVYDAILEGVADGTDDGGVAVAQDRAAVGHEHVGEGAAVGRGDNDAFHQEFLGRLGTGDHLARHLLAQFQAFLQAIGVRIVFNTAVHDQIDGDDILYIIARARLRDNALRGNVVGTLMTNLGLELALRELGVGLDRTDVGDRYIIERLLQNQWNLGGEPSGHIICLDRTTTGDGIISALQVIAEVAQTGQPLHELVEGVEKCPQILINVSLGNAVARDVMQLEEVMTAVRDAEADLGDEGRVLLRPSGTEPLIRVMVEGTRGEQVERLSRQIADVVAASVN